MQEEVVGSIGCEAISAPRAFTPEEIKLAQTVANLLALGPERALTGPVARGDVSTVRAHVHRMAERENGMMAGCPCQRGYGGGPTATSDAGAQGTMGMHGGPMHGMGMRMPPADARADDVDLDRGQHRAIRRPVEQLR